MVQHLALTHGRLCGFRQRPCESAVPLFDVICQELAEARVSRVSIEWHEDGLYKNLPIQALDTIFLEYADTLRFLDVSCIVDNNDFIPFNCSGLEKEKDVYIAGTKHEFEVAFANLALLKLRTITLKNMGYPFYVRDTAMGVGERTTWPFDLFLSSMANIETLEEVYLGKISLESTVRLLESLLLKAKKGLLNLHIDLAVTPTCVDKLGSRFKISLENLSCLKGISLSIDINPLNWVQRHYVVEKIRGYVFQALPSNLSLSTVTIHFHCAGMNKLYNPITRTSAIDSILQEFDKAMEERDTERSLTSLTMEVNSFAFDDMRSLKFYWIKLFPLTGDDRAADHQRWIDALLRNHQSPRNTYPMLRSTVSNWF